MEGLLAQNGRMDVLHPLLEHPFRSTPYLSNAQILTVIFQFAGVKTLTEFKQEYAPEFKGQNFSKSSAKVAEPKLLTQIKTKVCYC